MNSPEAGLITHRRALKFYTLLNKTIQLLGHLLLHANGFPGFPK